MGSRRGAAITAGILASITAASFAVWLIPSGQNTTFVVTDYEANLDDIKGIRDAIVSGLESEFQMMEEGIIDSEQYTSAAKAATSQINAEIIRLVESDPPEQWQKSYTAYLESLRGTNTLVRESIVLVRSGDNAIWDAEPLVSLRQAADEMSAASDEARP